MESYSSLLEAFEALNERKRRDPSTLSEGEKGRWKEMRREIEQVLFEAPASPAADTREFLRVPVSLAVRYWTRNEMKDRYIPVLGEGGLFVSTVDPLPVGSQLDLEVVLAQKGFSLPVKGEVVWVNEGEDPARRGMGIRFADLNYEQKRIIYGLVDDNLRQRLLERRRFARIDAHLQVQFVYAQGFFELHTEDLSLGGLFIATDQLVPLGEKIRLVLHVPGGRPAVKAIAEVARLMEHPGAGQAKGFGVHFVDLDDEARETVRRYMGARVAGTVEPAEGGAERRRHPRIECQVKLRFQVANAFRTSYSRDISTGGVFIQTHEPLPLGQVVAVSLVHPVTLQILTLSGRVVRLVEADPQNPARVPGVGVAFEPGSPEILAQLKDFLRDFAMMPELQDQDPADPAVAPAGAQGPPETPGDKKEESL